MTKKKSFLIHIDSLDVLDDLNNEQCGELFKAIKAHHSNQEQITSSIVKIAFSPFKNQFIRDDLKYQNTCKARAYAGSKGGKQKVANASKSKQMVANVADNKNKNKNKSDNDSKDIKRKAFKKPDAQEVSAFGYSENLCTRGFFDYYESNGWKVGRNSMKDWKASARGWSKRQSNYSNQTDQDFSDTSTDWVHQDHGIII